MVVCAAEHQRQYKERTAPAVHRRIPSTELSYPTPSMRPCHTGIGARRRLGDVSPSRGRSTQGRPSKPLLLNDLACRLRKPLEMRTASRTCASATIQDPRSVIIHNCLSHELPQQGLLVGF